MHLDRIQSSNNSLQEFFMPSNDVYSFIVPLEVWKKIFAESNIRELVCFSLASKKAKLFIWENYSEIVFKVAAKTLRILSAFPNEEQTKMKRRGYDRIEKVPPYNFELNTNSKDPDWYQELNVMLKTYLANTKDKLTQIVKKDYNAIQSNIKLMNVGLSPLSILEIKDLTQKFLEDPVNNLDRRFLLFQSVLSEMMAQGFMAEAVKFIDDNKDVNNNGFACKEKKVECFARLHRFKEAESLWTHWCNKLEIIYSLGNYAYQNKDKEFLDSLIKKINMIDPKVCFIAIRISLYLEDNQITEANILFDEHARLFSQTFSQTNDLNFLTEPSTTLLCIESGYIKEPLFSDKESLFSGVENASFINEHLLKAISQCWSTSDAFQKQIDILDKERLKSLISFLKNCTDPRLVQLKEKLKAQKEKLQAQ